MKTPTCNNVPPEEIERLLDWADSNLNRLGTGLLDPQRRDSVLVDLGARLQVAVESS